MKDLQHMPETVKDIQNYLEGLYGNVNKDRTFEYIYSYFFRNASYLSRNVSKESLDSVPNFIKTLSWLFTLANKLDIDIENSFLKKFPNVCPYCIYKPCVCSKTNKKPFLNIKEWEIQEELTRKFEAASGAGKLSMDKAVSNITELYPANIHVWKAVGPTFHFFRLFEELGEVHEAYTSYCKETKSKPEIENELADCFAWILSAWEIRYPTKMLQDSFIAYYFHGCPVCSLRACGCKDYSDRGGLLVKLDDLKAYKRSIEELLKAAPEYSATLTEVIADLECAESSKTTSVAISAVKKSESKLEELEKQLDSLDKSGKSLKSIVASVISLGKSFSWIIGS